MMSEIKTLKAYEDMLQKDGYKVVMFISEWCPDCAYADKYWPHFKTMYDGVSFYRVEREVLPSVAMDLNIYGVPGFVVYKNDRVTARYVDKFRKTFEQVKAFLDSNV